jgi:hypothetical protein
MPLLSTVVGTVHNTQRQHCTSSCSIPVFGVPDACVTLAEWAFARMHPIQVISDFPWTREVLHVTQGTALLPTICRRVTYLANECADDVVWYGVANRTVARAI